MKRRATVISTSESPPPPEIKPLMDPSMHETSYIEDKPTTTSASVSSVTQNLLSEEEKASPPSSLLTSCKKNVSRRRSQVKNACVNCQKACKKCDEGRPCQRCIKLGITSTCQDSPRKERMKGFKRGPYRKKSAIPQQHIIPKKELSVAASSLYPTPLNNRKAANVSMRKKREPKLKINTTKTTITNNITTTEWSSISSHSNHESPSSYENYQHRLSIELENGFHNNCNYIPSLPPKAGQLYYPENSSGGGNLTVSYSIHNNAQNYQNSIINNNNTTTVVGSSFYYPGNSNNDNDLFNNNPYQQQEHSRNNSFDGCYQYQIPELQQSATTNTIGVDNNYGYNNSSYYYDSSNVSSSPPELDDICAFLQPNLTTTSFNHVYHTSSQMHHHPSSSSSSSSSPPISNFFDASKIGGNAAVTNTRQARYYPGDQRLHDGSNFLNSAAMMFDDQQWVRSVPISASSVYCNPSIAYQ